MKETMARVLEYRKHEYRNGISEFQQIEENKPFHYNYGLNIMKLTTKDVAHLMANGILIIEIEDGDYTVAVIAEGSIHDKSSDGKPIHDKLANILLIHNIPDVEVNW
jgi:hypothetical protein